MTSNPEVIMPVAIKLPAAVIDLSVPSRSWLHLILLGAAGLSVYLLALTYGLDMSPGLF
jgi:hypothetical protein